LEDLVDPVDQDPFRIEDQVVDLGGDPGSEAVQTLRRAP
jgi:hypothetical protein